MSTPVSETVRKMGLSYFSDLLYNIVVIKEVFEEFVFCDKFRPFHWGLLFEVVILQRGDFPLFQILAHVLIHV